MTKFAYIFDAVAFDALDRFERLEGAERGLVVRSRNGKAGDGSRG